MIDPPPDPFPVMQVIPLPTGTVFHRIHGRAFDAGAFNPGLGRPTRFAPLRLGPTPVPTMYAAEKLECSIFETILHDYPIGAAPGSFPIPWATIDPLDHSLVRTRRALRLAQLREPDLNRIGLTRADLITCPPSEYAKTAAWALALHDALPHADGIQWTSRACDPHWSALLFGDRIDAAADLEVVEQTPIRDAADRLDAVRLACLRIGAFVVW